MKILMVCLGNICRSPLAEGIMQEKIRERGLEWSVDSAGTGSWHIGEKPDVRSISEARRNGIDITRQRARQFKPADLDQFDLILAMDNSNLRNIQNLITNKEQGKKVHLIMDLAHPGNRTDVPDPYWDDDGFSRVYRMLDTACDKILDGLLQGEIRIPVS
ncbi:MAG: low molecular weight protein-tyrosine-phosphatase [Saprospiraceae bacterium]|nr:low molecular weight phosphotyrosine protein phosphatase [Lewinella sp.]